VVAKTPTFLEPAPAVPVSPQIRRILRNDNDVSYSGVDSRLTSRADIRLARLIRLDRMNHLMFISRQRGRRVEVGIGRHAAMVRLLTRKSCVPSVVTRTGIVHV
jgi:hypothetical protein